MMLTVSRILYVSLLALAPTLAWVVLDAGDAPTGFVVAAANPGPAAGVAKAVPVTPPRSLVYRPQLDTDYDNVNVGESTGEMKSLKGVNASLLALAPALAWLANAAAADGADGAAGAPGSAPRWSPVYAVRGTLLIPYAELEEPFYAWFDSARGESRIDYYGGMVKTYQLGPAVAPPYGTNIKVAPVTTESQLNRATCLQMNGTAQLGVAPQTVLPDLTDFKYMGSEYAGDVGDAGVSRWGMVQTIGDKVNKYTMWVKYRQLRGGQVAIPVRYEMKGYNSLLGSHYDHYYVTYDEYAVDPLDPGVFAVDRALRCAGFPGPGARATFNPLGQFVHPVADDPTHDEFQRFKTKHARQYASEIEHEKRINIFRQNLRLIHSHNRAARGYTLAVNHLADRTDDELRALRGRRYSGPAPPGLPDPAGARLLAAAADKLPAEFDWRLLGAVTSVKDQSVCGSCWSFGVTGAVEGALFLHNGGHLVRLSQQALVDCSWGYGNNGCDGGEDYRAYQWIMRHGLPTEEEYGGYLGQDGYCHIDNVTLVTSMRGWVNVTAGDERALRLAIFKNGPVSVAIDASHKTFSFYSNGVYYEPKCKSRIEELDHAVLAVGYGALGGRRYWLVKNSWSNLWGNDGYVLMASRDNNCGVMTAPTYVLI